MYFRGKGNGNDYTITTKGGKLESVLVKSQTTCERTLYKPRPVMHEAALTKAVFEEALRAVGMKSFEQWNRLYYSLSQENDFGQKMIEEILFGA